MMFYHIQCDQSKQSLVTKQSNVYNIRNVSFSYEHQEIPTLSNINLTVGKGEKVAIVGPSGSGKVHYYKS